MGYTRVYLVYDVSIRQHTSAYAIYAYTSYTRPIYINELKYKSYPHSTKERGECMARSDHSMGAKGASDTLRLPTLTYADVC
jgi:hypothetical protein